MKIRRYVLQTETEQDIGHVFIDKETRGRYHQLFIIYCTNKKKSEVQRRVFEKKETRYKFIYIYIPAPPYPISPSCRFRIEIQKRSTASPFLYL